MCRFDPTVVGLSPRLRGNRPALALFPALYRSIPAPAGEPTRHHCEPIHQEVYPRACGGTMMAQGSVDSTAGPIPAPAGEPHLPADTLPAVPVYPRACGGTTAGSYTGSGPTGLSPRLRGNRG